MNDTKTVHARDRQRDIFSAIPCLIVYSVLKAYDCN